MNTKIARRLNEALKDERNLKKAGQEIVDAYNIAVSCGYVELPHMDFVDCEDVNDKVSVIVRPTSGLVVLDDLYNLKGVWGADVVELFFGDGCGICLTFKNK